MNALRLEHFMGAGADFEGAQYRVLGGIQQVRRAFARNLIYPYLAHLIKLYESLTTIVDQLEGLRASLPGTMKEVDLKARRIVYEKPALAPDQMSFVEDLIRWALPHIQAAIEEGRTVYEFVDEHLHLEEVGILPSYVEEGYLILPDLQNGQLHVLQYTLSVFTSSDEQFRSLRTAHVKSLPQHGVYRSPQSIKLDLLAEHRELPNPATYFFATDLEFPFESTVLPIAKRKLMAHLAAWQRGQA